MLIMTSSHSRYGYIRLDGSSKIHDRRDMVADFQNRDDIFVFLLSTRAGGLGINLTAADTVIFYDSDWNPTVDQQAMDRAHRLGQTKQVTVYRMVTTNTVEERILQRATQKSEIQKMVMTGGQKDKKKGLSGAELKSSEVVSLLLDNEISAKIAQQKAMLEKKEARWSLQMCLVRKPRCVAPAPACRPVSTLIFAPLRSWSSTSASRSR